MEKNKGWGRGCGFRVVREGLAGKVMFEQRSEGGKGRSLSLSGQRQQQARSGVGKIHFK